MSNQNEADLIIPLEKSNKVYKSVKTFNWNQESLNRFTKENTLSTEYLQSIKCKVLKSFAGMSIKEAEQFIKGGELLECLKAGVTIQEDVIDVAKHSNTLYFTQQLFCNSL